MKERVCAWNGDIERSIKNRKDYNLYINECYWILDIDDNFEFYFNPTHFLGKIDKKDLPKKVFERIKNECICFNHDKLSVREKTDLKHSYVDMVSLDKEMNVGNWFYAQGYNYVTYKGKFIRSIDPYGGQEECNFYDIKSDIVQDMLRMKASTKSHFYVKSVFDLHCFRGISTTDIIIKPLGDFAWSSGSWKFLYESLSKDLKSYPNDDRLGSEMRFMRKDVYMHTLFVVQKGYYFSEDDCKIDLPDDKNMIENTKFYSGKINSKSKSNLYETEITVENLDSLIAAKNLLDEGYNPVVLNMANRQKPGGGVYSGAGAQEENLFRRTNLFRSLYQFSDLAKMYNIPMSTNSYPMDRNFGGIYSPDVTVFRGLEKDGYPLLKDFYKVSIISVAAMNRPQIDSEGNVAEYLVEGIKNKIRTILRIAEEHAHDSLVLGAFGCGAFKNPPTHIAKLFHEIIDSEFKGKFKKICFAILEDHNSVRKDSKEGNFLPFYNEFCEKKI